MSQPPSKPLATPGAPIAGAVAQPDRMGAPVAPDPAHTQATAPVVTPVPVKTTEPLKGTPAEIQATLLAQMAEMQKAMQDMQRQLNAKAAAPEPVVPRPTVAAAQKKLDEATDAQGRKPILTNEGWLVHQHSFEQPNADLQKLLRNLGAGASMPAVTASSH